jgi:hypothetical protein
MAGGLVMKRESKIPALMLASVLSLLLVYTGAYMLLVDPKGSWFRQEPHPRQNPFDADFGEWTHYKYGGRTAKYFFWPAEQIDRRVRRHAWPGPVSDLPYAFSSSGKDK